MASHFLFSGESQEIVPFNAQYGFPSQATRTLKNTVKITPRDGGPYYPNNIIRIDLPAQGYLNPLNTTLRFGVQIYKSGGGDSLSVNDAVRLQKNANCVFNRLRILYGSLVIEDIQDYNVLTRILTNATVAEDYAENAGAVYEGLGSEYQRARYQSNAIVGSSQTYSDSTAQFFQVNLLSGLLTQRKLIPLKWMASQLRIELYVAPAYQAIIRGQPARAGVFGYKAFNQSLPTSNSDAQRDTIWIAATTVASAAQFVREAVTAPTPTSEPTDISLGMVIGDVQLIAEILEFDNNYDAAFYQGLMTTGVPIHFMSWHSFPFAMSGQNAQYPVQERAKSIKAAFAAMTNNTLMGDDLSSYHFDSLAFPRQGLTQYQWRVGGKYYPSQPVNTYGNACEAFTELQKALNMLGDYSAGCQIKPDQYGSFDHGNLSDQTSVVDVSTTTWGSSTASTTIIGRGGLDSPYGLHMSWLNLAPNSEPMAQGGCSSFILGTSFEATNGLEISGINGEEQNDILLRLTHNSNFTANATTLYIFTWYDAMINIRPNNVVDLIF